MRTTAPHLPLSGASDSEHTVIAAQRQRPAVEGRIERATRLGRRRERALAQPCSRYVRVESPARAAQSMRRAFAGLGHANARGIRRHTRLCGIRRRDRDARERQLDVDAIEKRPRKSTEVPPDGHRRT